MKKLSRIVALLLALVMLTGVMAGCTNDTSDGTNPADTTGSTTGETTGETNGGADLTYTWDVTFVFDGYDALAGEVIPDFSMTEKANAENTLTVSPVAVLGEFQVTTDEEGNEIKNWSNVDIATMVDEENNLNLTGELKTSNVNFVEDEWTVVNNGATLTYEVVTPLTEGDAETHGELKVVAAAPDYCWDITFVYGEGASGSYEFVNPGLTWGEPYDNQRFEVTPDSTSHKMYIFNYSNWIVDNTQTWYQWVVTDLDDECPYYYYEVVKPLDINDRATPGELTITISLTPIETEAAAG